MTISIDLEKSFDKIQYLFMIKALNKLGLERRFLNYERTSMKNPKLVS